VNSARRPGYGQSVPPRGTGKNDRAEDATRGVARHLECRYRNPPDARLGFGARKALSLLYDVVEPIDRVNIRRKFEDSHSTKERAPTPSWKAARSLQSHRRMTAVCAFETFGRCPVST
jgi:hypothetical protein